MMTFSGWNWRLDAIQGNGTSENSIVKVNGVFVGHRGLCLSIKTNPFKTMVLNSPNIETL